MEFSKAVLFLCLLKAFSEAADALDKTAQDIEGSAMIDIRTTVAATEEENSKSGTTPKPNEVLDEKVDTLIDRIFGKEEKTEKTPGASTESDLDGLINQIFSDPVVSTSTPKPPGTDEKLEVETCTTPDGKPGVCVRYYMCVNNSIIMADGKNLVDIRADDDGSCQAYLDECCLLQDEAGPITEKPAVKGEGCGWRNSKGVDNNTLEYKDGKTKFGEFPWMCAIIKIEFVPDNAGGQKIGDVYVGGGSLIHHSVVLTAAHYVASASRLRVRAGAWDALNPGDAPHPYQLREVTNIDMHNDFNAGNLYYDVALLYLSAPMVPAPNVGVVCLPPPRERVPAGTRCFATGWGKDRFGRKGQYQVVLKRVEVPVVGRATCQNLLRESRLGRYFRLHTSFMCAGGEEGKDTCKGDGGSPLSCPIEAEEDRYMQSGIVAWGIGCGEPSLPGVYVDVSNLRTWIDERVTKRGYDPKIYTI